MIEIVKSNVYRVYLALSFFNDDGSADCGVVAQGRVKDSQQLVITYRILSYHSEQAAF